VDDEARVGGAWHGDSCSTVRKGSPERSRRFHQTKRPDKAPAPRDHRSAPTDLLLFLDDHALAPPFNWRGWPADRACSIPNLFSVSRDKFENRAALGFIAKGCASPAFTFLRHAFKILVRQPPLVQDPTERSLQCNRAATCRDVENRCPFFFAIAPSFRRGRTLLIRRDHMLLVAGVLSAPGVVAPKSDGSAKNTSAGGLRSKLASFGKSCYAFGKG
jgi:hypothetical protein